MTSYPRWKFIMVALVLIVSIIYSIPNLYTSYPALEVIDSEEINLSQVINVIDSKIKPENVISKDNKFIFKFSNSKKQLEAYNKLSLSNIRTDYTLTSYTNLPDWLNSINAYPMFLGLDLKGGVHFLLQVDRDNIKTNLLREISDEVKDLMIENKFRYDSFYKTNDKIIVNFDTEKPIDEIIKITKETIPDIARLSLTWQI